MARRASLVLLGVVLVLSGAEMGVRAVSEQLPDPRAWPTPETEIKISQIENLQARGADIDVVFAGSSVLESGIDPEILRRLTGLSSYNAALPFSSPLSNEILLRDFVLPHLRPSKVVIGLGVWPNESTEEDDMLANGLNAIGRDAGSVLGSELVARRQQFRNWSATAQSMRRIESGAITQFGHQTVYYDMVRRTADGPSFTEEPAAPMNEANRDALIRTVEHLLGDSIEVVIMIEPLGCPPIRTSCPALDLKNHPARAVAEAYGLDLIDATSRTWPAAMYADSAHLNLLGTESFTAFVSDQLLGLER